MHHEEHGQLPNAQDIANKYNDGQISQLERRASEIINDLETYFNHNTTIDIPKNHHKALRKRWGFDKRKEKYPLRMLSLKEVAESNKLPINKLLINEIIIIEKLGFRIKRETQTLACNNTGACLCR